MLNGLIFVFFCSINPVCSVFLVGTIDNLTGIADPAACMVGN